MKWWENNVFIGVMALTAICICYIFRIPESADKVVNTAIGAIAGFVTGVATTVAATTLLNRRKDDKDEPKPE